MTNYNTNLYLDVYIFFFPLDIPCSSFFTSIFLTMSLPGIYNLSDDSGDGDEDGNEVHTFYENLVNF
jgi:hypothetical protein